MSKRLVAKVDEYQKDGQTKGKYVDIGVILSNDKGEYVLLDPTVNIAGVLAKQNSLNAKHGKESRDMVMASIFSSEGGGQQRQQQSNPAPAGDDFSDDIPFNRLGKEFMS